ncbi:MAG: hypothetical protein QMC66_04260, partial [Ascidiaceihabitans sp.]
PFVGWTLHKFGGVLGAQVKVVYTGNSDPAMDGAANTHEHRSNTLNSQLPQCDKPSALISSSKRYRNNSPSP